MHENSRDALENWRDKSLAELTAHIVATHHAFCRQEVTRLAALFKEVIDAHSEEHPELKSIQTQFFKMSRDLSMHMAKEEQTLFPYIERFEASVSQSSEVRWPPFGTVGNPIRIMVVEHDQTNRELEEIRKLSAEYTPPADATERHTALYKDLASFDRDMQRHIELENDLLFPRAIAMEEEACARQKVTSV